MQRWAAAARLAAVIAVSLAVVAGAAQERAEDRTGSNRETSGSRVHRLVQTAHGIPAPRTVAAASERRLPAPRAFGRHQLRRRAALAAGQPATEQQQSAFREIDLLAPVPREDPHVAPATADGRVQRVVPIRPAVAAELRRLSDLRGASERRATVSTGEPLRLLPARTAAEAKTGGAAAAEKTVPWSADRLLADPTHMNDEHVSLQVCPTSGNLYAVFHATDLGGTDRDIHIARSSDGGATWQAWEMPSFSEDEYQPELAIDGAGYLYVTWIRDDGTIVRTRSENADDPLSWAWVRGLVVGEPCATPTIAVSGAGQFSTVFVAAAWLTVNWDLYQYEWTLVWMYSTNGGDTVVYDYFLPDGYPDLWPDVALDGGTAYLINGEQDFYTSEVEILVAADAVSGTFTSPISLTAWTGMNCGFPSLAADGENVYCAYQLDYDDGLGNIDGDIIYCFSWDGCATVYGPYEIVADEYESVGPAIYTRDGIVGCLWLDAPPNADEFDLAASQAGQFGDPAAWGAIEIVTDANHVEPTFRSAAGAVATGGLGGGRLHAAWIDRRDYPTAGLNVYTSDRGVAPNLAPFTPDGWEAPFVANPVPGERTTGPLGAGQTAYVSFAFTNTGLAAATAEFRFDLLVDGAVSASWTVPGGLPLGSYVAIEDHELTLPAGVHELGFAIDTRADVAESDETDNLWVGEFEFVSGGPELRLTPVALVHQAPAPGAGKRSPQAVADDPPLARRFQVPVVAPRLADALRAAPAAARLRVVVEPALRLDLPALSAALAAAKPRERAAAVRGAAREQLRRAEAELAPVFADLRGRGALDEPARLWLPGVFVASMTPEAVHALANNPAVGRLWLDDRWSEAFAVGESSRAAADSAARARGAGTSPQLAAVTPEPAGAPAWQLERIGADLAWAQGFDGTGVIVGHTDSGVAYDHPDLAGHLWDGGAGYPNHGWDFLDEDDDPYDGDTEFWHGTHTAGLIVGDGTSGTATGAAPGAVLMIARCVPGYFEDLVEALQFCLDNGADVISTSAGWGNAGDALRTANRTNAELLLTAGIPWICAAGNGDNAGGHYPVPHDIACPGDSPHPWFGDAGHSAVVTVGATTAGDLVWSLSGYGPTAWAIAGDEGFDDYPYPPGLIKPDICAPGDGVVSTLGSGGYVSYSGTSMATPLVAGAVAILLQAAPALKVPELAAALELSARDIDAPGRDSQAGAGLLDIPAALAGLPSAESEAFWAHNDGPLPLFVTGVSWTADWLDVAPQEATIAAGDSLRFTAQFDAAGLGVDAYFDTIVLTSNDPDSPHELPVRLTVGTPTGVGDGDRPQPLPQHALSNYPNPFNPRTVLSFVNPSPGHVRLAIHDLRGRRVRILVDAVLPAGAREVVWDGTDAGGEPVASGVYLARLELRTGRSHVHKLALLR
jgi:subtilisin family serine protease